MFQSFSLRDFFLRYRRQIFITIFLFWLIYAALIFIEGRIALSLAAMEEDPVDKIQYAIRWILWTFLTPVIIYLAIRFPVRNHRIVLDIARHFFMAITLIGLEFVIEIPIVRMFALHMTGMMSPWSAYAAVFILKFNIYLLLYFLVLGTTYLVLYVESHSRAQMLATEAEAKNQQLQSQLAESKLRFLKMQLDPHFLFNTHHAVISLMLDHQNEKAIQMLTWLSDLLRLSLEEEQQTIPLEKEIQILRLYLDIQQIRFHDRMKVEMDIDANALNQKVPAFILQPLVENAIKHGIAINANAVRIRIHAHLSNGQLELSVENDGASIDFNHYREGIGISNTRTRLQQLYNGRSTFELRNQLHNSVIASITLPVDKKEITG